MPAGCRGLNGVYRLLCVVSKILDGKFFLQWKKKSERCWIFRNNLADNDIGDCYTAECTVILKYSGGFLVTKSFIVDRYESAPRGNVYTATVFIDLVKKNKVPWIELAFCEKGWNPKLIWSLAWRRNSSRCWCLERQISETYLRKWGTPANRGKTNYTWNVTDKQTWSTVGRGGRTSLRFSRCNFIHVSSLSTQHR